ncbi:MAG: hypothetical protein HY866_19030, partial [Chloroflexi bacterium]|nr:hypothetical protein [Chloroflexota bacterium]
MLRIRNFNARYYLQRGAVDEWQTQRRLDRIVTDRLPQAMGDYWNHISTNSGAVYRIRNLHISLWLDDLDHPDGMIASVWARLLAKAIVDTLQNGTPANVVRYDDYAHFLAAFLADLLVGQAWRRWMYEEFRPLEDVPVGRAAALLLSPHPELLVPVAQRLQIQQNWEALVLRMEAADISLIWDRGFGFTNLPMVVPLDTLDGLPPHIPLERGGETAFMRNRLRLFVALHTRRQPQSLTAAAALSHHAAL